MSELLINLTNVVDALTQPTQHRTPQHTWDKNRRNRNKIRLPDHVTVVPGLLTQLAAVAFPLTVQRDGGVSVRSVPQSREPGNPRALTAYLDICGAVERWAVRLDLQHRETLASRVRGLLGAAPAHPYDVQIELLSAAGGWLAQCEQVLGLREKDTVLTVPCPDLLCGNRTLLVDLEHRTVRCLACGARWADREDDHVGSLAKLAAYVTKYRQHAADAASAARAEDRRRKAAMWYDPERL